MQDGNLGEGGAVGVVVDSGEGDDGERWALVELGPLLVGGVVGTEGYQKQAGLASQRSINGE